MKDQLPILALPRDEQVDYLKTLDVDQLKALITTLAGAKVGLKLGMLGSAQFLNTATAERLVPQVVNLLKQFPEVASTKLALDRKFDRQETRMNAIIDDINSGRMPEYRYAELLHENLFKPEDLILGDLRTSRTFLAYALPKIKDAKTFDALLRGIKARLGDAQFKAYMETPMYLDGKEEPITIEQLYLQQYGKLNEAEFGGRNAPQHPQKIEVLKKYLEQTKEINDIARIDTHNVASHRSADESHVGAFKAMLQANPGLGVGAKYSAPNDKQELHRHVAIDSHGNLDTFVQSKLEELSKEIDAFISADRSALYDMYVRIGEDKPYDQLDVDARAAADKKIDGLLFEAGAAKRFMDNMINEHKCNSGSYSYDTNVAASCGLTIEQMVAATYWASKDKKHFKSDVKDADVLLLIIKQLYDMRRGYDIDDGTDKPDINEYPSNPGQDNNRCHGGGVNSLASALHSVHEAYNVKLVQRKDIEQAVQEAYVEIVRGSMRFITGDTDMLRTWSSTGKITGQLRDVLQQIFEEEYKKQIEDLYKGYVGDAIFAEVMLNGLDNVPMPDELKVAWSIEKMSDKEIAAAINKDTLPLMYLDKENGYISTLNYLSSLPDREELLLYVVEHSNNYLYLSKSNLPDEFMNIEFTEIGDLSITLRDIKNLTKVEYDKLIQCNTAEDILTLSIEQNMPGLFDLYAHKVGFTPEILQKGYGYQKQTPLHWAIQNGHTELVKEMLILHPEAFQYTDSKYETALHIAVVVGNIEIINAILATPAARDSINIQNGRDETPLDLALNRDNIEVVKALLRTPEGSASLSVKDRMERTPLHLAVSSGNTDLVKAMLETTEGRATLSVKDKMEQTPLHLAASRGNTELVKAMLETTEGRAALSIKDRAGSTPLMYAVEESNLELVELILTTDEGKSSLSEADNQGVRPIDRAITEGSLALIEIIIASAPDTLKQSNSQGLTPLHLAAMQGRVDIVKLIIDKDALCVGAKDNFGGTPLHIAAYAGQVEVIKMMLENKPTQNDLDAPGYENKTALELAVKMGHKEVVDLITEYQDKLKQPKTWVEKRDIELKTREEEPGMKR